jgi:hypothetical protein
MDEVAQRLHKSRRWLQDFVRDHPFYRLAGRTKLFTEGDIARLVEALPCPSSSSRRAKAARRTGMSEARTLESLLTEARRLLSSEPRGRSSSDGDGKSSAANIALFPKRS